MLAIVIIGALFAFAIAGAAVAFHNHTKLAVLASKVEADKAAVTSAAKAVAADVKKV